MPDSTRPTLVLPQAPSLGPEDLLRQQADLAALAFGGDSADGGEVSGSQHLAFLHADELALDLSDPAQCELGDYTLTEKLGQGGMGVVYRARQHSLGREVAIKLLSAGPWASQDFIERFRREAQSAARLEHPNIVTIFEIGRHEEFNYFSMRLVRGASLSAKLAREGPFEPRAAAQLLRTIALALDYAHRLGVLHLDLKPGNVLIDEQGQPLVADFGLARRMDESLGHDSDEVSGTPSYMAPEQVQTNRHRLSASTDIYGLGAVFYEVLTGLPPFLGGTAHETLLRVTSRAPEPPRQLRDEIPADLDAICLKCLAKEPGDRYPSAQALADDLGRFLDGRTVSVRRPGAWEGMSRWARREPRVALATGATVLALAVGLAATLQQWQRAEGNAAAARELVWEGRREAALRLEEDGKGYEALPRLLDNIEEQERDGRDDLATMERLRAGLMLNQGAVLIDRIAIADANPLAAELSPDGSLLALSFSDQTVRWYDTDSLAERGRADLADLPSSGGERRPTLLLRFVGNDRLLATLEWYSNLASPNDSDSWLIDLADGAVLQPPAKFADFSDAIFSSDGRHALLRNRQRQVQYWQVSPWRALSAPYASAQGVSAFMPWLLDPRGRHAFHLKEVRELGLLSLPGLDRPRTIALPGNAGVSAWMLSSNGRHLALGDFEGRVFLLDTDTLALRTLPTTRGREVTWLAFSEDDAWLAAATFDGVVHAFSVDRGDSLASGQLQHDYPLQRVGISRSRRLLVAAGTGRSTLWRLPQEGVRAAPAQRIGAGPTPHGLAGRYPIGWALGPGLLASAGIDGQVRLWRLPHPVTREARASSQMPDRMVLGGERLVDVEWNRLRIVADDDTPLTPWLELPQPPGFAELLDDGRLLALTMGPELRIYDAGDLRLRHQLPLPMTPQRLIASRDGRRLVLGFAGNGADGFEETLQLYDGQAGRALAATIRLPGPLHMTTLSRDERWLAAVGPGTGSTVVLATEDLARVGELAHEDFEPVQWAAFAADDRSLVLATRADDPRLGSDSLVRWRPDTDEVLQHIATAPTRPLGVVDTAAGAFVSGSQHDLFLPLQGEPRVVPHTGHSEPLAVLALSSDGRLLARGYRREVQLFDAATLVPVGPTLRGDSHAFDIYVRLAFAADGSRVFARTWRGNLLSWPIVAERQPAPALRLEQQRLSPGHENQRALHAPTPVERAELRSRDPGAWRPLAARPLPALAAGTVPSLGIPARLPGTSPLLLDLSPVYDSGPEVVRNTFFAIRAGMRGWPYGVQRFGGTEFDLRGMVSVGVMALMPDGSPKGGTVRIDCLAVPDQAIAALTLLVRPSLPSRRPTGHVVAWMTLHYRDGGEARLPLRAGIELPGYAGEDQSVPWALGNSYGWPVWALPDDILGSPRLANPEPGRLIRCVDLEADNPAEPMLVVAVTAEAATGAPRPAR